MDSLTDYILWMQDFTFSETGFLDVDALILSNLAYYDFSALFDDPGCRRGQCGDRHS